MKSKEFIRLLNELEESRVRNKDSILIRYEEYLLSEGIYCGMDTVSFRKNIKGHKELCDEIIKFYKEAKVDNDKLVLLEDLYAIGYDKNKIVEMILDTFNNQKKFTMLWEYGDLLYRMKRYKYLQQYISIINDDTYGEDRQMIILLVGKSKNIETIPILKGLLDDSDVCGHALEALTNFTGDDIEKIMFKYLNYEVKWVRNIAEKYLKKQGRIK